jgi:glycosyltransferase involved in cell wall biosynthesis
MITEGKLPRGPIKVEAVVGETKMVHSSSGVRTLRVLAMVEASCVSGTGKPVLEFVRQASRDDIGWPPVHVTVLTFARGRESEFIEAVRAEGFPVEIIWECGRFDLSIIDQLRAAVVRCRPDVLWSNSVKSHFLIRAAGLNRKIRWIAFHHGYTAKDYVDRLYSQLDRWSLRAADRVVTVCRPFAEELEWRNRVARHLIRVQHVPVRPPPVVPESELIRLRYELGLGREHVILTVGRLSKEKGHADFIRGILRLREFDPALPVRALIVGDGPERCRLEGLCSQLALRDTVRFLGYQSTVQPYYELADVFVLPSHNEGTPNVLLEAMASNLPLICTTVGGVPELATDNVDALMIPMKDPTVLARAIIRVLKDQTLANRLADSARSVVASHSPEQFFYSIRSIFMEE